MMAWHPMAPITTADDVEHIAPTPKDCDGVAIGRHAEVARRADALDVIGAVVVVLESLRVLDVGVNAVIDHTGITFEALSSDAVSGCPVSRTSSTT